MRVRRPAVAGTFYPDDPEVLRATVDAHLASGRKHVTDLGAAPKAVIVPHAGYIFSGPIAGSGYAALASVARAVTRVVLLGPAHRVAVDGLAVPSVDAFLTPLGGVAIDPEAREIALSCADVAADDVAHAPEHSLEVQLPFLQQVFAPGFRVLPIVVGHASPDAVAAVIDALWGGPETLFVVSSDLSHYEPYDVARAHDRRTAQAIVDGAIDEIGPYDACGVYPVRGLLAASARRGVDVHLVDLRSSGDTAGPPDRVVGYGAFVLTPAREEAA